MNPWGVTPNEVSDDCGDPEQHCVDGLKSWTVSPTQSSRWVVGVVLAVAYAHLPNAKEHRHNYDDGRDPKGYEEEALVALF